MVLVLNYMKSDKLAASFNRAVLRPIGKTGKHAGFLRIPGAGEVPDLSEYSHVIISGSEASVVEDNPWDAVLEMIIHDTIEQKKPLLGICYGHQFIVRTIAGRHCVKKSGIPEIGWADIRVSGNPLFEGITAPVCMVSHYDEVCNLTENFKIIASTPGCPVHGFQYKNRPVWGVQFHPEYNIEEANEIFDLVSEKDPLFLDYYSNAPVEETRLKQNEQVFINFFSLSTG